MPEDRSLLDLNRRTGTTLNCSWRVQLFRHLGLKRKQGVYHHLWPYLNPCICKTPPIVYPFRSSLLHLNPSRSLTLRVNGLSTGRVPTRPRSQSSTSGCTPWSPDQDEDSDNWVYEEDRLVIQERPFLYVRRNEWSETFLSEVLSSVFKRNKKKKKKKNLHYRNVCEVEHPKVSTNSVKGTLPVTSTNFTHDKIITKTLVGIQTHWDP